VDLLTLADTHGPAGVRSKVEAWLDSLRSSADGRNLAEYLTKEVVLPRCTSGQNAVRELLAHIDQWGATGQPAFDYLMNVLDDKADDFLCRSRGVVHSHDTGTLCRLVSLEAVYKRYRDSRITPSVAPIAIGTRIGEDAHAMREWARDSLVDGTPPFSTLRPDEKVRGKLKVSFLAPLWDIEPRISAGASAARIQQLVGKPVDSTDQCLLQVSRASVEPCTIPSALDASRNDYFVPAHWNARWGRTRDLAPTTGSNSGVRECVVRPFRVAAITKIDLFEHASV